MNSSSPAGTATAIWPTSAGLAAVIDLRNNRERGRGDAHPLLPVGATEGIFVVHAPTEDADADAALLDRRPAFLDWIAETDVRAYLLAAGVSGEHLDRLERLLIS